MGSDRRLLPLNTATHTQHRSIAGGRDTSRLGDTQVWMGATERRLEQARETAQQTHSLRQGAQKTTGLIERETRETHGCVNDWLKRKVEQTLNLKQKLERTVAQLSEEMDLLQQRMQRAAELLQMQRAPLAKAQHRLRVRGTRRPTRENIHDPVQDALIQEAADVQAALDQLKQSCDDMSMTYEQMALCKASLRQDLADKTAALELDTSCLAVPGGKGRPAVGSPGKGFESSSWLRKTLADAVGSADLFSSADPVASAGDVRHLARQSATHPTQWKMSTEANINAAVTLMSESRQLRRRVQLYAKQALQSTSLRGERTCQELEAKIRHTSKLASRLQRRLDDIDQELADISQQRAAIQNALQEKEAPLHVCARRLALRRQRPQRETVRDDAEISLQAQLDRLVRNCKQLEDQYAALCAREQELRQLRAELDEDKRDKERARELDTELLTLDPVVARPSLRGSQVGSRCGSASLLSAASPVRRGPGSAVGSTVSLQFQRPGSAPPPVHARRM
eukprot:TRINITY_DN132_c0_g2_i1.p1 TRINITY_DN132_c0_g2~~TRINITY_DN132_c0_g2_i1.p1  ORF type:complete len:549 (+),score=182.96 TRINITY_DN132_c0_g2_i1:115-1647(+)